MSIKTLNDNREIDTKGTYRDGTYFKLSTNNRKLVDNQAEEICLATRFLSLPSNKVHSQNKHELKYNLIKGDDIYPRSITSTLNTLQYHSLWEHNVGQRTHTTNGDLIKT